MEKRFWVYIITDKPYGTLYIGVTNDLARRAWEHHEGVYEGHAKKHGIKQLVHSEEYPTAIEAITREKKLKKWKRAWKIELVKGSNFAWKDLYDTLRQ